MEHITDTPTLKAPAGRFTGDVYLNMIEAPADPARLAAGLVRFTPGARTNWHSHALGQLLYVTSWSATATETAPPGWSQSPTSSTPPPSPASATDVPAQAVQRGVRPGREPC
jgi:hypothetical protein